MFRRALTLLLLPAVSLTLVLALDATPSDAYAVIDAAIDGSAPDYVPDEALRADAGDRTERPPELIGSAPAGSAPYDPELTADEARALLEASLNEPFVDPATVPVLGTLIDRCGGFPELTSEERAVVERILYALKDRLAELAETPNDAGETLASPHRGCWLNGVDVFLQTPVPGWGETYAEAARRMIAQAIEEALDVIACEKRVAWAQAAAAATDAGALFETPERILRPEPRVRSLHIDRKYIDRLTVPVSAAEPPANRQALQAEGNGIMAGFRMTRPPVR